MPFARAIERAQVPDVAGDAIRASAGAAGLPHTCGDVPCQRIHAEAREVFHQFIQRSIARIDSKSHAPVSRKPQRLVEVLAADKAIEGGRDTHRCCIVESGCHARRRRLGEQLGNAADVGNDGGGGGHWALNLWVGGIPVFVAGLGLRGSVGGPPKTTFTDLLDFWTALFRIECEQSLGFLGYSLHERPRSEAAARWSLRSEAVHVAPLPDCSYSACRSHHAASL